jgi:predicted nucleotidyltransferase
VNAQPILFTLARVFHERNLEAVLIGNAAAALQGAPVTTLDFDFLFRKTPLNLRKLKAIAKDLGAVLLRPYYPASGLFRLMRDDDGLQLDFMAAIHGVKSFSGLRGRAEPMDFGGHALLVASLPDIIRSKRAAGRPRDKAVLETLEQTLKEKEAVAENPAHGPRTRKPPRPA